MFETADGLLINELAMRPPQFRALVDRRCGDLTFENHLRAVLDLPGEPGARAYSVMVNVIGTDKGRPVSGLPTRHGA